VGHIPRVRPWPDPPKSIYERMIDEAKQSYVDDRCAIEELEEVIRHVLWQDFPIPEQLAIRTLPITTGEFSGAWAHVPDPVGLPLVPPTTHIDARPATVRGLTRASA